MRGPWSRDRFRHGHRPRWPANGQDGGYRDGVFAALDLGTNNCRLLVARPREDGFRVIDAFSRIVRLGEGLGANGALSEPAMGRTIEALKVCASKIQRRGVTHARHVATEACRRASNCQDFVERVRAETGLVLEIITSREEAELALAGCAPLLDPLRSHALVFDIGGGSTELLWLKVGVRRAPADDPAGLPNIGAPRPTDGRSAWGSTLALEPIDWISLPLGVVGLSERCGPDRPLAAWYEETAGEVAAMLAPFERRHGIARLIAEGAVQMLGSSGTVTTLAGVNLRLPRYDRSFVDGTYLAFDDIDRVSRRLAAMTGEERAGLPCIGRDRADLVVAGCAILDAICRTWPVGSLRVADRGVREGILMGLMRGFR
ncbi:MAG: Ppx/GppA family phosphatase [Alphaproteobacteria bacterium]|nr:Ppx/GppA family phosphatase [Alphaproteobacteria bacterium]